MTSELDKAEQAPGAEPDHERIWLQSWKGAEHQNEGRLWCQDKVWPEDEDDGEPTEYIRADLAAAEIDLWAGQALKEEECRKMWQAALAAKEAECEGLKKLRLEDMLAFEGAQMRRDEDNIKLRAECEALRKRAEAAENKLKQYTN